MYARRTAGPFSRSCLFRVVCHERRLSRTVRNCTRDGGGPSGVGSQVLISSHCKLLLSKATVVSVAEAPGDLGSAQEFDDLFEHDL
jgi:hypothetical protein